MVKPEDKNATPFITDYKEYHTGGCTRLSVVSRHTHSVCEAPAGFNRVP